MRIVILLSLFLLTFTSSALAQDTVPADTPLLLHGQLTNTDDVPLAGYTIEIWQTDINAVYDHPGDADPADLIDFQYFGTATTDDNGVYMFLTVLPGKYESRPVHIHWKVKLDGETLFVSQFYFTDETDLPSDDTITLTLEMITDVDDTVLWRTVGDIVLDMNGSEPDMLLPTLSQAEGPFYPVVDFDDYDNNLIDAAVDEEPFTGCGDPVLAETIYNEMVDVVCETET